MSYAVTLIRKGGQRLHGGTFSNQKDLRGFLKGKFGPVKEKYKSNSTIIFSFTSHSNLKKAVVEII